MPHIDIPAPHVDLGHVDVPAPHIDVPAPHIDVPPPHVDIPPPHVDFGHLDIPSPHIDIPAPHIDIPSPHIDIPSPHIDIASPHIDIPTPHVDIPAPHIDVSHTDTPPPPPVHVDTPPPPHVDAAPPHVDVGYNHWWQNWPKTHRYIAARMLFPTSVDEIAAQVKAAEADRVPLRAVGGGWSFSDASLPGNVGPSLAAQPATGRPDVPTSESISAVLPLAQGFPADDQPSIASIDENNGWLIGYNKQNVRLLGGARPHAKELVHPDQLAPPRPPLLSPPEPQPAYLINTRSIKSVLQPQLSNILSPDALKAISPGPRQKHYFHVEGGITMEELARVLDAHSPRLQLQASGGNRGATLAGALSTATHGAEFLTPLLSDRVKAVHLVGPGGQQWWIEGSDSIADVSKLLQVYPGLDQAHVIAGTAPINDLLPQDWLNALAVSMGCMGVIYSVVLEVFAISGSEMVTRQTTWFSFLEQIQSQTRELRGLNTGQLVAALRNPADPHHKALNDGIADAITQGTFSGGLISAANNKHGEMAFNPNPAQASSQSLMAGDCDCWVMYRQVVPVPLDPQPPGGGGMGGILDAVFKEMGKEFGVDTDPANMSALVIRLAQVYGISKPFHVDIPPPHIDIPSPHIDVAPPHIDIPPPHIDVPSPHIDIPPPHIDIPPPHIDLGHIDVGHVDIGHVDLGHFDLGHVDIPPPHIDIPSPHIDIPPPHIDIPPPHIDIPPPHIDIPSPHIDIGHVDLNKALESLLSGAANPLAGLIASLLGLSPTAAPILKQLILGGFDLARLTTMIDRVTGATDTLDAGLDVLTAPMAAAGATDLARPFLTGFLAGTMGTANDPGLGISIGTEVGAVGFPSGGVLGAGIEIGLPLESAFPFLQTEILDKMRPDKPFFGYVSIRFCPQTATMLGMQQWAPITVMIEVVSFGDDWGRQFISELQAAVLAHMAAGKDAMLHHGLENEQMTAQHLSSVPVLQQPSVAHGPGGPVTKLEAFKLVRGLLFANQGKNPATLFPAFNNSFTARLKLD